MITHDQALDQQLSVATNDGRPGRLALSYMVSDEVAYAVLLDSDGSTIKSLQFTGASAYFLAWNASTEWIAE